MATVRKLKMKFTTDSGEKTWSFKHVQSSLSSSQVNTLATAMINNGSIYNYPPIEFLSGIIETTTSTTVVSNE